MNILENQYIVPVLVGTGDETVRIAKMLRKKIGVKANIFAKKFALAHFISFNCHKVSPFGDEWVKEAILDFSRRFEEYYCPVFIVFDDYSRSIAARYADVGCAYLVINKDELFSNEKDLRKGESE